MTPIGSESSHSSFAVAEPGTLSVTVQTCAKAIVCGEHAVLYGAPAVSIPLPSQKMVVTGQHCSGWEKEQFLFGRTRASPHVAGIIRDAYELLKLKVRRLHLNGISGIPIGSGLGSSAALSVAVLKVIASLNRIILGSSQLADMAKSLEARFHGRSSGLDTATVAWEAPLLFSMGQDPVPLKHSISSPTTSTDSRIRFCLVDSGLRSSTFAMIQRARPWFTSHQSGSTRVATFVDLAEAAGKAIESENIQLLSEVMNQAHILLAESGVSNHILEKTREQILAAGALAAKITGAGGGGCLLVLLNPINWSEQLRTMSNRFGSHRVYPA